MTICCGKCGVKFESYKEYIEHPCTVLSKQKPASAGFIGGTRA